MRQTAIGVVLGTALLCGLERAAGKILRDEAKDVLNRRAATFFDVFTVQGNEVCAYGRGATNARAGDDNFLRRSFCAF